MGNKITGLAALTAPAAGDYFEIVDVSDTTGSANGTNKKITYSNVGAAIGSTIASATTGSVLFAGASGVLAQANSGVFYDETNKRLGIGQNNPLYAFDLADASAKPQIHLSSPANTDSGAYIMSNNQSNFYLLAGFSYDGTNWKAKAAEGGYFGSSVYQFGDISVGRKTGMTPGATITFPNADLYVHKTGEVAVNSTTVNAGQLNVVSSATTKVSQVNKAVASQTANLMSYQDSSGTTLSGVDASGRTVLATVAGTPSGTPATGTMVYDTTNNKIWVYNGAWRSTPALT